MVSLPFERRPHGWSSECRQTSYSSHVDSLSDRSVDLLASLRCDLWNGLGRHRLEGDGILYDGRRNHRRPAGGRPWIPRLPDNHRSCYPENRALAYADQPLPRCAVRDQSVATDGKRARGGSACHTIGHRCCHAGCVRLARRRNGVRTWRGCGAPKKRRLHRKSGIVRPKNRGGRTTSA